ncbi:Uncharacterized protein TCM_014399 [Theobroma cacao]|uniref:Uncharacterized protein n=1 Tax=Theobroma cacao TaxID=3641 RepID=A0A061FYS6_THECC|nr:Uncharacterized protein TCM_014399 [Theobroma cacao]
MTKQQTGSCHCPSQGETGIVHNQHRRKYHTNLRQRERISQTKIKNTHTISMQIQKTFNTKEKKNEKHPDDQQVEAFSLNYYRSLTDKNNNYYKSFKKNVYNLCFPTPQKEHWPVLSSKGSTHQCSPWGA